MRNTWSHLHLGVCARELQQWRESIREYERVLELNPELRNRLAFIDEHMADNYYNLAKEYAAQK